MQNLGKGVASALKDVGDTIVEGVENVGVISSLTENDAEAYQSLWEANETIDACRACNSKFLSSTLKNMKTKHHCRHCASIYCMECVPYHDRRSSVVAAAAAEKMAMGKTPSEQVRLCSACARGECPGTFIRDTVNGQLEVEKQERQVKKERADRRKSNIAAGGGAERAAAEQKRKKDAEKKTDLERFGEGVVGKLAILGDTMGVAPPPPHLPLAPAPLPLPPGSL